MYELSLDIFKNVVKLDGEDVVELVVLVKMSEFRLVWKIIEGF